MTPLVRGLGYVRVQTRELDRWRSITVEGLGFAESPREGSSALHLRMDEREERLVIEPGPEEKVLAVGWEVRDQFALSAVGRALEASAVDVELLGEEECHHRRVDGAIRFTDPSGLTIEVFHGPVLDDHPVRTRWMQRFVTGDQGMGAVAVAAPDVDRVDTFYTEVLGFLPRGAVQVEGGAAGSRPLRARLLGVNRRHHVLVLAPGGRRWGGLQKVRVEVDNLDAVGAAQDEMVRRGWADVTTLGRHTNDRMLSFYVRMPGGWMLEYGTAALPVDETSYTAEEFTRGSRWGHDWRSEEPVAQIAQFPGKKKHS